MDSEKGQVSLLNLISFVQSQASSCVIRASVNIAAYLVFFTNEKDESYIRELTAALLRH